MISSRGIVFLAIFSLLAFMALQVPVFALEGITGKSFTLFDFFGPIAGSFIGLGGVAAVFMAKLAGSLIADAPLGFLDIIKLTPMMFAAYYFWRGSQRGFSDRLGILVPAVAMLAFWLHPVGQSWITIEALGLSFSMPAGAYALYWLIPIAAKFLPDMLLLRSLGATFTQHALGSVLFLYTIPTAPAMWLGLIPIVAMERGLFALGISASHVLFTNMMEAADRAWGISKYVNVEKRYVLHI